MPTALMPTLTDMARPKTPPPDLDNCKDIVVKCYKSVFGFTNSVATAFYNKQLMRDKDSRVKLNDNEANNVMRVIRRHPPLPNCLRHGLSLPFSGSSTRTTPSARSACQAAR